MNKILKWVLIIVVFIIGLGVFGGLMGDKSANLDTNNIEPKTQEPIIKISAINLYEEYKENEVRADELYKDKQLEVFGIIGNIGKDILDDMYVTLQTDNYFSGVQGMIKESEKNKVINLQKGQEITLECKNSGKLINVILRDCIIK